MSLFDRGKRRLFFLVALIGIIFLLLNLTILSGTDVRSKIAKIPIPGLPKSGGEPGVIQEPDKIPSWEDDTNFDNSEEVVDLHPISQMMMVADQMWTEYKESRSMTFRDTINKYRRKYGRHPPPGFKEWYQYARERNVYNIDDFEQIMDDLRPFWAVEPKVIRSLAAHMWEKKEDGIAGIHIRNHKVVKETNSSWRSETLITLIKKFISHLPDMDIAMNRLDQPRVVVPWEDMQILLSKELETRQIPAEASDSFTTGMSGYLNTTIDEDDGPREDPEWYPAHGKQYMDIAKTACPPESHARNDSSTLESAEDLYKSSVGSLVTNFNRSSDLCTIGPEIQDKHGFLFSSSTVVATKRPVPVFGECKVSVNSDILFPANMYWKHDDRYDYDDKHDLDWDDKSDIMVWRGVTSGGVQVEDNWQRMHRQRLVMLLNNTEMADKEVSILSEDPKAKGAFTPYAHFHPSKFAEDHTDVGFVETWGCVPNCDFYNDIWTLKPQTTLSEQFRYKFVVDVDGHSFSGRWRAFLESKSLGIKATIFREWHDSRLFAWRHFVPMDNRFDDVYSLLTYFIGVGRPGQKIPGEMMVGEAEEPYVSRHDFEGKRIARQGREWASKVLRRDDIEIYTFRLLLEYARIIDDNRDRIGYAGDGSELDKYDSKHIDR
ncbi:MAG: hypothetical protein M1827_006354 [Pycnora praestabilis]|nr:MAG: hypothetical protein M1827_006354 [Pycnora praestabilis]